MSHPLISFRDLIVTSWKQFIQDWKQTLEITIWLLAPAVLIFAGAFLANAIPQPAWSQFIFTLFSLAGFLFTLTIALRLEQFLLRKDRERKIVPKDIKPVTKELVIFFLLIALLELLAIVGGLFVFFLPGIWLAVALMFSTYAFLEDGTRGVKALAASLALVKGRWWKVFWRTIVGSLVFTPLIILAQLAISLIIGLIAGPEQTNLLLNPSNTATMNPVYEATRFMLQAIIEVVLMPLFVILQVKLFHSLKDSR